MLSCIQRSEKKSLKYHFRKLCPHCSEGDTETRAKRDCGRLGNRDEIALRLQNIELCTQQSIRKLLCILHCIAFCIALQCVVLRYMWCVTLCFIVSYSLAFLAYMHISYVPKILRELGAQKKLWTLSKTPMNPLPSLSWYGQEVWALRMDLDTLSPYWSLDIWTLKVWELKSISARILITQKIDTVGVMVGGVLIWLFWNVQTILKYQKQIFKKEILRTRTSPTLITCPSLFW